MFLPYQGFAQPTKPAKGQKFIPPIFSTWRTGEVVAGKREDGETPLKKVVDFKAMDDALSLLPPNVVVEFKIGFDKVALESYYEMTLVPPFPPESCNYGTLWTSCIGEGANQHPDPHQKPISREFGLYITKQDVFDTFAAVGATAKSVSYRVRGNGHSWEGNYFVAKDGQTMWAEVFPDEMYVLNASGSKQEVQLPATILQVYHRIAPAKAH